MIQVTFIRELNQLFINIYCEEKVDEIAEKFISGMKSQGIELKQDYMKGSVRVITFGWCG